nr:hypothetical protein [uncultured Tateyamaria sp.]
MMTFAARNAPRFMLDVSSIDHAVEHIADFLLADMATGKVFWKVRLAF